MKAAWKRLRVPDAAFPLLLAGVAVLAYGLLFRYLGFYWDEWPMTWIAGRLGPEGLARYFATNRPYWGMIYRLTTQALGATPWHWQLFGLFWRWASAAALWAALRQIWPGRRDLAAFASLLFLIYPGFSQQSIGMMYGHFFVVLTTFLLSLWLNLLAMRRWSAHRAQRAQALALTVLALLLALVNLLAMEYFFLLELVRPLVVWIASTDLPLPLPLGRSPRRAVWRPTGRRPERGRGRGRSVLARTLRRLLPAVPYFLLFLGAGIWRAFFFPYQTQNYRPGLLTQLAADPLRTLLSLAGTVLHDLALVTFGAWARAFRLPDVSLLGARTALAAAGVALAAAGLVLFWFALARALQPASAARSKDLRRTEALAAVLLGLAALLAAGPPFWLTQLPVALDYPNDRFTLPFLLGFALFFAGLIGWLPRRGWQVALVAVLVGASAGLHFQQASAFRRDWNMHRALFWQMSWRAPGLQPGTTLVSSDLPLKYYSDNSLTGPLNWVYAPENHSQQMDYMFYYASVRSGRINLLQPGQPIRQDYLAARFDGVTDHVVALAFHPPACLRVLDPDLDPLNGMLPELMRDAARISQAGQILPEAVAPLDLTPAIFGSEPARGWCYYFEKASLAAAQDDWRAVAQIGEQAFALADYPNDPMERVPFIEGYAHTGAWERAGALSREAGAITPLMRPVLCRLWQRIEAETPAGGGKDAAVQAMTREFCGK